MDNAYFKLGLDYESIYAYRSGLFQISSLNRLTGQRMSQIDDNRRFTCPVKTVSMHSGVRCSGQLCLVFLLSVTSLYNSLEMPIPADGKREAAKASSLLVPDPVSYLPDKRGYLRNRYIRFR